MMKYGFVVCFLMSWFAACLPAGPVQGCWETTSRCSNYRLLEVWCHSETDAWCVGGDREMYHWNGFSWDPVNYGTSRDLRTIWGFGSDDVYAAGEGSVLHWNGQTWSAGTVSGGSVWDIWGFDTNHVIITAGNAIHQGSHSAGWSTYFVPDLPDLYDIWGSAPNDIYILASQGRYTHYDGSTWTTHQTDFEYNLGGIWGFASDDIFIVGYNQSTYTSLILHYDGSTWTEMPVSATANLYHVWGAAPDDVYAVGGYSYGSEILHYDGTSWSSVPENDLFFKLFGVHGSSAGNVFAVGDHIAHMHTGPQMTLNLDFRISGCRVLPGDSFSLNLRYKNYLDAPQEPFQMIVALEVAGAFFFYPGWSTGFESVPSQIPENSDGIEVFPEFTWPDTGSSTMSGLRFWAVAMDDTMSTIISNLAVVTWGFGP